MKLQRYNLGELARHYASDKDNVVCRAYDVEKLEESHTKLIQALEAIIKLGEGIPDPTYEVEIAKAALDGILKNTKESNNDKI